VGAALVGTAATTANAQIIPFTGTTMACFSATLGCTPTSSSATDLSGKIVFNGTSFNFGVPNGTTVPFQLGSFNVGNTRFPVFPINEFFTLAVNLTNPITGTNTFQALAFGALVGKNGGAQLHLTFSGPGLNSTSGGSIPGGSYMLTALDNSYFSDMNNQALNGTATATVTPEPLSMTLFGTGLTGLAFLRRRRKKEKTDA